MKLQGALLVVALAVKPISGQEQPPPACSGAVNGLLNGCGKGDGNEIQCLAADCVYGLFCIGDNSRCAGICDKEIPNPSSNAPGGGACSAYYKGAVKQCEGVIDDSDPFYIKCQAAACAAELAGCEMDDYDLQCDYDLCSARRNLLRGEQK